MQYHFSKATTAYVEAIYQRASGDGATTRAWINGLLQPDARGKQPVADAGSNRLADEVLIASIKKSGHGRSFSQHHRASHG